MVSEDPKTSFSQVPRYAKVIIVFQTMVILFYVFWTYEEYVNNQYFQNYLNNSLQGGAFGIIAISTVGIFSAIASGLFMKLHNTRKELESIVHIEASSSTTSASASSSAGSTTGVLEPHVEQHLINMIRKSSTDAETGTMPVLKREEPSGQAR
jgi:uncharacterized protein YqgC (DUF456 family)